MALLLCAWLFSTAAYADETGICGSDLTWTLDTETGVLEISGTGEMFNYSNEYGSAPWYNRPVKTVIIGDGVTSIGDYAFYDCRNLTSVTIPESVTTIGTSAFAGCRNLTSVTIPGSVTTIGNDAFSDCMGLTEVTMKNGVQTIGDGAFSWCEGLTSVTIPESVQTIGDVAFYYCTDLQSVTIQGNLQHLGRKAFPYKTLDIITGDIVPDGRCIIIGDTLKAFASKGATQYSIPDDEGIAFIGDYAFEECTDLQSVTIPNSVTFIGNYAFYDCTGLTSVTIPENVTTIGNSAFESCRGLTAVKIPDNVESIGDRVFSGCAGLETFEGKFASADHRCLVVNDTLRFLAPSGVASYSIPDNVKVIGRDFFENATDLAKITIPRSVVFIESDHRNCPHLKEIWFNADSCISGGFESCPLETVHIGENVKRIPSRAFYDCDQLKSVTIPDSVATMGYWAFFNCDGLTSVTIGRGVTDIGDAFDRCDNLKEVWFNADSCSDIYSGCFSAVTTVHIGENVKRIPDEAFWASNLTSVTIPKSVTSIGDNAFRNSRNLTEVWFNADSCISGGFNSCVALTTVHIGENVKRIPDRAFYDCTGLKEITIPDNVESIGNRAFYGCMGLEKFDGKFATDDHCSLIVNDTLFIAFAPKCGVADYAIPNTVTIIDDEAFSGCTGLTSVTIPKGVTTIGNYAFSGCTDLTSVTVYNTTPPEIYYDSFSNIAREDTLYVPAGSVDKYRYGYAWNYSFSEILPIEGYVPEAEKDFKPSDITPDNGAEVTALKTFTLIFTEKPALAAEAQPITLAGNDTLLTATLAVGDGNTLVVTLADTLKAAGEYTLTIPESTFGDAAFAADPTTGHCNPELVYTYTITESEPAEPDVPDEPENPDEPDVPSEPENPDTPDTPDVPDEPDVPENPDEPDTPDTPDVPDEPENPDKPDEPVVPDEPASVTETPTDAEHIAVYNLQGVLVLETNDAADLKTLQNGAYIVNGKKMIIVR